MINAAQEVEREALNNPEDVHVLSMMLKQKFFAHQPSCQSQVPAF